MKLRTFSEYLNENKNQLDEKLVLKRYKYYKRLVAEAYHNAPKYDPSAVKHWKSLSDSCYTFFKRLTSKIDVIFVSTKEKYKNNPSEIDIMGEKYSVIYHEDPYETQQEMKKDYEENNRIMISMDYSDHPVFSVKDNIVFRTVHDYIVHIGGNHPFGTRGEIKAYNLHAKLAPNDALPALFTEIVGQACYYFTYGYFPEQKIAVLEGFDYENVGEVEGYDVVNKKLMKKK
jgi:hypothetical protein